MRKTRIFWVHVIQPLLAVVALFLPATVLRAQVPQGPPSNPTGRPISAIGYQVDGGSTNVDLNEYRADAPSGGRGKGRGQTRGDERWRRRFVV